MSKQLINMDMRLVDEMKPAALCSQIWQSELKCVPFSLLTFLSLTKPRQFNTIIERLKPRCWGCFSRVIIHGWPFRKAKGESAEEVLSFFFARTQGTVVCHMGLLLVLSLKACDGAKNYRRWSGAAQRKVWMLELGRIICLDYISGIPSS